MQDIIPAQRVIRVLERIVASRGYRLKLRMDNEPEFINPEKPTQNAFIEPFNRTYRPEILDFICYRTLYEAREITE